VGEVLTLQLYPENGFKTHGENARRGVEEGSKRGGKNFLLWTAYREGTKREKETKVRVLQATMGLRWFQKRLEAEKRDPGNRSGRNWGSIRICERPVKEEVRDPGLKVKGAGPRKVQLRRLEHS